MGGLGLSSTFLIRQAAWLGSWTQTKNLIKSKLQETSFGNILDTIEDNPYHSVTVQSVKDTYDWMGTEFRRANKQLPALDQLETIKEHAQRFYADATLKNLKMDLLDEAPPEDRARLLSAAGPKAGSWLNSIPKLPLFQMGNADYRIALRLRLGLPQPCIRTDVKCRCGRFPDAYGVHYLTCTHGDQLDSRHEQVVKAAHEMVQATSKHSSTKGLEDLLPGFTNSRGHRLVLDQHIAGFETDGSSVGLDFAVCNPCAPAYLPAAKQNELAAAEARCKQKTNKYDVACRAHSITFRPAVMEVFGAMSQHMEGLITKAAKIMEDALPEGTNTTWTADSFSAFHQQRLSITLQRANAKAIRLRAARDIHAAGRLG